MASVPEFVARCNLNHLAALAVLLEVGSVSEAARRLGMTQSGLSHALAQLRAQLDDPLLVRVGDRMMPTPRAQALREPLEMALRMLGEVVGGAHGFDPRVSRRAFLVAARDQFALPLTKVFLRSRVEAPHVSLEIAPYQRERVGEALAAGRVDLAVGVDPPDVPGLLASRVYREEFVVVVREGHPLLPGDLEAYLSAEHVVVAAHATYRSPLDEQLARSGHARRVALRLPYFLAVPFAVATSDLVATLPRRLTTQMAEAMRLRVLPAPEPVRGFDVHMFWHERFDKDPGLRWLRGCVEQLRDEASIAAPEATSGESAGFREGRDATGRT